MTTETIDKLFLELSQFTKAQTERELALINHDRWRRVKFSNLLGQTSGEPMDWEQIYTAVEELVK